MSNYDKLDDKPEHADTEITLGLRSILGIFFGLVLICGIFFGFGYSLGRSNAVKPSAASAVTPQSATAAPSPVTTVVEQPASTASTSVDPYNFSTSTANSPKPSGAVLQAAAPATSSATATQPPTAAPASAGPAPAGLAQTARASYTIPSAAQSTLQPPARATAVPQSPIMVQIAAISRPEDADTLISALQKRGFNASVRRDGSDNLLHIQIGPFATRQQAMDIRTRLLNDGYNAILK